VKPRPFGFFRTLHAWGGVTLALLMLLSSVTGTLLVWKNEYVKLRIPEARTDFVPTPEALANIAGVVEASFDNDAILLIQFATARFPLTRVTLADTRYAYLDTRGRVVDQWVQNERFEEWLYDLHHRLLLDNPGLTVIGLAALAMAVLVLAGVIAFWPARRGLRRGFWPGGTARAQLLGTHRNIGIVAALPFLLTLVTAALLAFPEQAEELLLEPFRGEDYSLDFSDRLDEISGGESGEWLSAMRRALASFPGARIRSAQVPNGFSGYRIIGLQQPGELHPQGLSRIYIDAAEGWMDIRIDAATQHLSERIYNTAYPLHTGRFDNLLYQGLLSLVGVLVAVLSSLGLICFVKRWSAPRAAKTQARSGD
jgi:uncharacterized iron-regulated membrane protein